MSSPLDNIFGGGGMPLRHGQAGAATGTTPGSNVNNARGYPLPNTTSQALSQIRAPDCSDWPIRVRSAATGAGHVQHALTRGEAIQYVTGERGIYLGRAAFGGASHSVGNTAATVCCIMRDASSQSTPLARLLHLDSNAAAAQLMYLPVENCPKCGCRLPADELRDHESVMHSAGTVRPAYSQQQPHQQQQLPFGVFNQASGAAGSSHQQQQQQSPLTNPYSQQPVPPNSAAAAAAAQQQQQQQPMRPGSAAGSSTSGASPVASPITGVASVPNAAGVYTAGDADLLRHLRKGKKLGEGAQGVVFQCQVAPPKKLPQLNAQQHPVATDGSVVLKSCRCADAQVALTRFQISEQLLRIKSGHLVPYFAVVYDPRERDTSSQEYKDMHLVHVIMPFYAGGTLTEKVNKHRGKFSEQWILSTILQLCNALQVLHTHKPCALVHGDVKFDNVMLFGTNGEQVLLMDLEASSVLPPGQKTVKADNDGTFEWRAPESMEREVSPASDMWSLGVMAMCLALLPDFPSLKNPETGVDELLNMKCWNDSRLYWSIKDAVVAKGYGERTAEIICSLVRIDPSNRPTTQVLNEVVTQWMETLIFSGKF